jgi:2-keto-4-pentenoate hydratase/2-oxohepta-3-ene-1,7-dioic acid hydratase in catechol pathway
LHLLTFSETASEPSRIGVLRGNNDRLVDIGAAARQLNFLLDFDACDMVSLIAAGDAGLATVARIVAEAKSDLPLSDVHLKAPIPRPRKNIFCVGWNYLEHFKEGEKIRPHVPDMPAHPAFFSKAPTTANGPCDSIPFYSNLSAQMDWEVELGLVIGKSGKDIRAEDAMQHVFGYCVINDISWRDVQRRHGQQWFKGKSIDGTCPMGPWITTAEEVDPANLRLTCRVNGVTKQDSNTAHMYFRIPQIIAELSQGMTLEVGDIIATGTPPGVGHARTPPEFMKPGDVLETEIAGLGLLRNLIVAA